MQNQQAKIIDQIYSRIGDDWDLFSNSSDRAARDIFYDVTALLNQLKTVNNSIKVSVENIRIVNQIKQKLNSVVQKSEYTNEVGKFIRAFDDLAKLNNQYFGQIAKDFEPKELYTAVKDLAIDNVKESLLGSGFKNMISDKLLDIVNQNMASGAKMNDLVDQVRIFLTDTEGSKGALSKFAKNYTYDAINKYNASYNQVITSDLGLEWYKYNGSLLETSREFCKELIDAKKNGMEYIHKSQFKDLLEGKINGKQIPINPQTKLPFGMEAGTNESNLTINRGGYGCGHQFMPVSTASVPKEYINKFKSKSLGKQEVKPEKEKEKVVQEYPNTLFYFGINTENITREDAIKVSKLAGIPLDFNGQVKVKKYGNKYAVNVDELHLKMDRIINYDTKTIENEYFRIYDTINNPYQNKGFEIFANQVQEATNAGFKSLECYAARGSKFNGYYTWARFGYLPQNKNDYNFVLSNFNREYGTNVKTFGELMATKEGQNYWKENGDGFNAIFDLSKNSYSQTTLKNYIDERRKKQSSGGN